MKKIIILLLTILCCSCTYKDTTIKENNILEITYNNLTVSPHNYEEITNLFNELDLSKRKQNVEYNKELIIKLKDKAYMVTFSNDNNYLKLKTDNNTYYSSGKKVEKLKKYLDQLFVLYEDEKFYKFEIVDNIDDKEESEIIDIEDSDKYIKITFNNYITDFMVHSGTYQDNTFSDQSLLYQNGYLKKNSIIYIKKRINYDPIKISFVNQYGTKFSVVPLLNEQNKVIFKTNKEHN